jgi:hypothetical protein
VSNQATISKVVVNTSHKVISKIRRTKNHNELAAPGICVGVLRLLIYFSKFRKITEANIKCIPEGDETMND